MEFIAMCANSFIDLFKAGAQIFTGFVTGIIPLVVVLMTAVNKTTTRGHFRLHLLLTNESIIIGFTDLLEKRQNISLHAIRWHPFYPLSS